jgi:hypothetical protein
MAVESRKRRVAAAAAEEVEDGVDKLDLEPC